MTVYLMSYPRADWSIRGGSNFKSSQATTPSPREALREWLGLASAIEDSGGDVLVLPPSDTEVLTGLPYTAEAGFYLHGEHHPWFLLPRMKSPHRRAERTHIEAFVEQLGWTCLDPCPLDECWEAQGDTLRIGDTHVIHTVGTGSSSRTTHRAIDHVIKEISRIHDGPCRHHVIQYLSDFAFHGNTMCGFFHAVEGELIGCLICAELLLEGELDRLRSTLEPEVSFKSIDETCAKAYPTNALQVENTVLTSRGTDAVHSWWSSLGLRIVELNLDTLFGKGGGAAVCLTNALWGFSRDSIPDALRFAHLKEELTCLLTSYPTA